MLTLHIACNATVRIDGMSYKCQPWGMVSDHGLQAVFRAFAPSQSVDDSVEFLYDACKDPCVLVHSPMSADRRAYYYRKYLEDSAVDWDDTSGTIKTLNLSSAQTASAKALFGPGVKGETGEDREFLLDLVSHFNALLIQNQVVENFWKSPEFRAHHAKNLAKNGPRSGPGGKLKLPQYHGHKVLRFGGKG